MENWIAKGEEILVNYGPKVVGALIILVVGYIVAKALTAFARRLMSKSKLDGTVVSFLGNLLYMLLLTLVVLATLDKLGVDTTTFAAVVAAAGLAIGFALKDSLGNFASGIMLIVLRPFKVGDWVEVADEEGIVEEIAVFFTRLRTRDNKVIIIPNGNIIEEPITNYTAKETRRIDMVFGIGYDDDIKKAKAVFEKVLKDHPKVLAEPAPRISVSELADSSVNFAVRPWVKTEDFIDVRFEITEQIKLACDAEGISIPFPQRDVHLHQVA